MTLQSKQIQVDLSKCDTIKCKCGSVFFQQMYIAKKVSGLMIGIGGQDQIVPAPVLLCGSCGEVLPDHAKFLKEPFEEAKIISG